MNISMKTFNLFKISLIILFSLILVQSASASESTSTSPLRVVSLAPSITDTLVALGYGENLVAISNYCTMQEGINKDVRRVGMGKTYNAEVVLSLKPDLVFGLDDNTIKDLPFHTIRNKSFNEILNNYLKIAELMGDKSRGEKLYNETQIKVKEIQNKFNNLPTQKVLIVIMRDEPNNGLIYQITAAGSDIYFNDLLNTLKMTNALEAVEAYPILNFEQIQKSDPDIIIDLVSHEIKGKLKAEDWQNMPLKAVKNNKVLVSHIGMVPGPRSLLFLDEIGSFLSNN